MGKKSDDIKRKQEATVFARELVKASVSAWEMHKGINRILYVVIGAVSMLWFIATLQQLTK